MGFLLGIDAGTTSLKVGLFGDDGSARVVLGEEYAISTPRPDWAELDPEAYWRALVTATRRALSSTGLSGRDIVAIAVSSQGETVTPVSADGHPIGPAIVWLDNRATAESDELARQFDAEAVYAATGVPAINPTWTASKLLWWRHRDPDLFAGARFLLVEDLLLHRLTGRFVSDGGVQSTTLLYDIRTHAWWEPMLDRLGLRPDQLPELARPGDVVGTLRREAADELGLDVGALVVAAGMDQGAGAIGVANTGPGVISESTGGALTLQASVDRPDRDQTRRTPVYVHSAPGRYLYCPVCPTGGMALTWFRDQFGGEEATRAATEGVSAYDLLTALADRVPPGADGLTMLPHLTGAFSPEYEPRARGVFFGFGLGHGKGHFVRAILESVAFMLRRNIELLADAGATGGEIHSHGGGARSALWCQIKADVCGTPVVTMEGEDAAVRGGAMLAGVAIAAFAGLDQAAAAMVVRRSIFKPEAGNRGTYDLSYRRYIELFDALRPVFAELGSGDI